MPLSYNLARAEGVGREERHSVLGHAAGEEHRGPTAAAPQCMRCNTCEICPTGARYSPDFTFKQLLAAKKIELHDQTLVRRLVARPDGKRIVVGAGRVARAQRRAGRVPREDVRGRVRLLLVAAPAAALGLAAIPNGLANRSGLVGRYMTGHAFIGAQIELDATLYPGHERAAQPDFAAVLPLRGRRAVRPPRPACLGELRGPRSAAARTPPASCCSATR